MEEVKIMITVNGYQALRSNEIPEGDNSIKVTLHQM